MRADKAQAWGDGIERSEHRSAARRSYQREARGHSAKRDSGLVVAAYLAVRPDGRMVQLHLPGVPPSEIPTRGECEGMSQDSQRRLMEVLHSIRRDAPLPSFVTLTFPEELRVTPAEAKQCRKAWEKRVTRRHGKKWCAVWRMEAQPQVSSRIGRAHPHFHLLTWGAWYDLAWLSKSWSDAVWQVLGLNLAETEEPADPELKRRHVAAGTNCERMRSWGGVLYSGKNYIAKDEEFPLGKAGRVWGWSNRAKLPLAEEIRIPLTHGQAACVRLAVEQWMRERKIVSEHLICTFFDDKPQAFADALLSYRWRRKNE